MEAPLWTDATEPVHVTTTWSTQQPLNLIEVGWRSPPGLSPIVAGPDLFFGPLGPGRRVYPAGCRAGRITHNVRVRFPDGVIPVRIPEPLERKERDFFVRQNWSQSQDGRELQVSTEMRSSVAGRVCEPLVIDAVSAAYRSVQDKLRPLLRFERATAGQQGNASIDEQSGNDK
jgi:hypothetical protein